MPAQEEQRPLRIVVNNILKCTTSTCVLSAKIESGFVEVAEKLFLVPDAIPVNVKGNG